MALDNDTGSLSPVESAIVSIGEEAISDVLVISGPGYEDFPCSEMTNLHVELSDPDQAGPLVDGPVSFRVDVEWEWDWAVDGEGGGSVLPATLTGVVANGVLNVALIEIILTPVDLPLAA